MTKMIDDKLARLRTHRNNIDRYRRLLKTRLTQLERDYIDRRLSEEQSALDTLAASTFPLTFRAPGHQYPGHPAVGPEAPMSSVA
jgi:hypothetical protein